MSVTDATTVNTTTATSSSTTSALVAKASTAPVWRVAAIATVAAAVVAELFALGARALDISMNVGSIGAEKSDRIPIGGFASATVIWGAVGVLLAVIFARRAKRPAHTYTVVAVAGTLLSFVPSLAAGQTAGGTKAVLCVAHIIVAAIIIPVVSTRLEHVDTSARRAG